MKCGLLASAYLVVSSSYVSAAELPVVEYAAVPSYPPIARQAGVDGVVRLRVTTDGTRVVSSEILGGPVILADSAKDNVSTWLLDRHIATTFDVVFKFKLLAETECVMTNGTVVLELPSEVSLSVKRVSTCDPVSEVEVK